MKYNRANKVNQLGVFFIFPFLESAATDFPRFRDCYLYAEDFATSSRKAGKMKDFTVEENKPEYDGKIRVLCESGESTPLTTEERALEEKIIKLPGFVEKYDLKVNPRFRTYVFDVPEKWKSDFDKIKNKQILKVSANYKKLLYKTYPTLKELYTEAFRDNRTITTELLNKYKFKASGYNENEYIEIVRGDFSAMFNPHTGSFWIPEDGIEEIQEEHGWQNFKDTYKKIIGTTLTIR